MYNDVVKIAKSETAPDDYGNVITSVDWDTAKEVFCEISSISQNEFYVAAQAGFKPSLKVKMADFYDYDGEDMLLYNGDEYNIIRTYQSGTAIELTAERFGGNGRKIG